MLRKVSSIPWHTLSHLKLREELSTRGLKRVSNKEEMVKSLRQFDSIQSILSSMPESPAQLQNPIHQHIPNTYLYKEIKKRVPTFILSPNMSKPELISSLKSLLIAERSSTTKDLRSLVSLSAESESLSLNEVILKQYLSLISTF